MLKLFGGGTVTVTIARPRGAFAPKNKHKNVHEVFITLQIIPIILLIILTFLVSFLTFLITILHIHIIKFY